MEKRGPRRLPTRLAATPPRRYVTRHRLPHGFDRGRAGIGVRDGLVADDPEFGYMFITNAYAQGAGGAGGSDILVSLLPFVFIFIILYFMIIRPQQRRMKQHQEMIANLRRGDTVVTSGGLIGKITKVGDENEITVEIAEGVRARIVKSTVAEVRAKGEPADAS
jgi:preprotein translocase subunit YajC